MNPTPNPRRGHGHRGLTLIELAVVIALLAVVASIAAPYFGSVLARHRLKAAAETLATDLAQARFEAAARGQALYLNLQAGQGGTPWCWAVATAPGCDCQASVAPICRLKVVRQSDFKGIGLDTETQLVLQAQGTAEAAQTIVLRAGGPGAGEALQVNLGPTGRAHVCSPGGAMAGVQRC